jgi:hypothetical protein
MWTFGTATSQAGLSKVRVRPKREMFLEAVFKLKLGLPLEIGSWRIL